MPCPKSIRRLPVLLLVLLAAACSTTGETPPAALGFARLDAIAADPADFRAAIRLANGFGPSAPRANLTLLATRKGGERVVTRVALVAVTDGSENFALAEFAKTGFAVTAFRIAPADLATLAPFRDSVRGMDALELTVQPEACRLAGTEDAALLTTYLRTDPSASYFVLSREADMEKAEGAERLPAC